MERYWFKKKKTGLGWTPATREGWLITGLFIGAALVISWRMAGEDMVTYFAVLGFLVFLLLLVCYRTGEPLKWSWG